MIKNYFFLNRFVEEANSELKNYSLLSVFSQEKDKLILCFGRNDTPIYKLDDETVRFIEISVNNAFPFIILRKKYARAKKNTVDFFEEYLPSPVKLIEIKKYDRVVRIKCEKFSIYFMIRGKFTNVILFSDEGEITSFKKNEEQNIEELRTELINSVYCDSFAYPKYDFNGSDELKKKYAFTGKEILTELKIRYDNITPDIIHSFLSELSSSKPVVFHYLDNDEYEVLFDNFAERKNTERKVFDSTGEAFYYYISKKYFTDEIKEKKNRISKFTERQLEKSTVKLNQLEKLLSEGSKEESYNQKGNILLININLLRSGMDKINLLNIYDDQEVEIKLDASFSPRENINQYFNKAKEEKTRILKGSQLKAKVQKEFQSLLSIKNQLRKIDSREEISSIMKELKMKENESTNVIDEKFNFKRYLVDGKYHVFVGKDSRNNDELTTRFAKQNDYWFHARGLPGSHVILRSDNTKEAIPKNIIKKAASLAAYHSKGKTAGMVPVSYAQKKYVVKKKGMEPGKVALLKEEVVIVKPEIPQGCEFLS